MSSKLPKRKRNRPTFQPLKKTEVVTFRLTHSEKSAIKGYCSKNGITVQTFVETSLRVFVDGLQKGDSFSSLSFDVHLRNLTLSK